MKALVSVVGGDSAKIIMDGIDEIVASKAKEKATEKYGKELLDNCHIVSVYYSRRACEDYLTASVKICIGDGDYIDRVVRVPLPEISFI